MAFSSNGVINPRPVGGPGLGSVRVLKN